MSGKDLAIFTVGEQRQIGFEQARIAKDEPLKLQLEAFLECCGKTKFAEMFRRRRASNSRSSSVDS